MQLAIDQKDIDKFLMVGDKVLIKPKNPQSQTKSGLYLPPTVQQEKIQSGYIIKVGPGFPLPSQSEEHEVCEEKILIGPHSAILMLVRDEGLFE